MSAMSLTFLFFMCLIKSTILPYSDKRKQLLTVTFLVNEQNLAQKLRVEVEHATSQI